ncbi:MAG: phosphinothricin acetyltransferase [Bacteroidetes bacterium]|jgi:phosphinothricin acetyltransferase|nr:phosphinothricin acetyltransferase [Bacteroidota bacterium]
MIRPARAGDATQIADIYNYYILNTTVTFEEQPVPPETMQSRIEEVMQRHPWLVFEEDGEVIGYSYATPWKPRAAYRHSVETSVYLRRGASGKGIGSALYSELLLRLGESDIHGVIGGMALPNDECIALHKKFDFVQVAHFKEVGFKFGKWVDVVYYEKLL